MAAHIGRYEPDEGAGPGYGPTVARLLEPDEPAWSRALRALPHDSYHLPAYVSMEASRIGGTAHLFCFEEDDKLFVVPLIVSPISGTDEFDACSPYGYPGPLVTPSAGRAFVTRACAAMREVLAEAGVVSCFIRMHPLLPLDGNALGSVGTVVQHGHTVSIDLQLSDEENWSQVRANHRRQIARTRRAGATVSIDDWGRLDEFLQMYYETMRRVGATPYYFFSSDYFDALRSALDEAVHLVLVDLDGEDQAIGGGIFFEECQIVQYHLGATHTEFLGRQPAKLMFDEVRGWAKRRGNLALHLGGGVQGADGQNRLFHFKRGFSRDVRPFYTWRVVVDPFLYAKLTHVRVPDADPDDMEGFFPAYRRAARRS